MPIRTIWVQPELFLTHASVRVFHTYRDDDMDERTNRYEFTLHPLCSPCGGGCEEEPCPHVIDVRELPTWQAPVQPPFCVGEHDTPDNQRAWDQYWIQEETAIRQAITLAINQGRLKLRPPAPCPIGRSARHQAQPAPSFLNTP